MDNRFDSGEKPVGSWSTPTLMFRLSGGRIDTGRRLFHIALPSSNPVTSLSRVMLRLEVMSVAFAPDGPVGKSLSGACVSKRGNSKNADRWSPSGAAKKSDTLFKSRLLPV